MTLAFSTVIFGTAFVGTDIRCADICVKRILPFEAHGVFYLVGTDTQLVILPPHIHRARRSYTVLTLLNDLCSGLTIFDFKWEG